MSAGTPFTSTAPPPQTPGRNPTPRNRPHSPRATHIRFRKRETLREKELLADRRSVGQEQQVIVVQHPFPRPAQVHDHPLAAVQRRGIPVAEHRHTAETSRRIVHQPLLHRFPGRRNELHFGRSEPGRRDHLVVSILRPHTLSGRHLPVVRSVEARKSTSGIRSDTSEA